jgi:hypothetical protein
MSVADLQWFDRLARSEIDPVLRVIINESKDRDPDYIVDEQLNPSPNRDRCLLSITNRNVNKQQMGGSFAIIHGTGDTLRVEQSYRWLDSGKPFPVVTLNSADVTQDRIGLLAREFVVDFFRRVSKA